MFLVALCLVLCGKGDDYKLSSHFEQYHLLAASEGKTNKVQCTTHNYRNSTTLNVAKVCLV